MVRWKNKTHMNTTTRTCSLIISLLVWEVGDMFPPPPLYSTPEEYSSPIDEEIAFKMLKSRALL